MIHKAIFAGFGGQGILMMGYTLAQAAMKENKQVTYLPSYGAEVRGGTAHCTVSVGDEEIASPIASSPEFLVAMNSPSLDRFQGVLRKGGHCLLNTSLVHKKATRDDIHVYEVPVSELAEKMGDLRTANMIMLGAFLKVSSMAEVDTVMELIAETFKRKNPSVTEMNQKALRTGYELFS